MDAREFIIDGVKRVYDEKKEFPYMVLVNPRSWSSISDDTELQFVTCSFPNGDVKGTPILLDSSVDGPVIVMRSGEKIEI